MENAYYVDLVQKVFGARKLLGMLAGRDDAFVRDILSIADEDGLTTVAYLLASNDGEALRDILADKDDEFVRDVLHGNSVSTALAEYFASALRDILARRDDEFVRDILSIKDRHGDSVAYLLVKFNGERKLIEVLDGRDSLKRGFRW